MIKLFFVFFVALLLSCFFYKFERKQNINFLYSEGKDVYFEGNALVNVIFEEKDCIEIKKPNNYIIKSSNDTTLLFETISDNIINHIKMNNTPPEINLYLNQNVKSRIFTLKGNGIINFKNNINLDSLSLKVINNGLINSENNSLKVKIISFEILNNGMINISNLQSDSISYYIPKNGTIKF